MLRWFLFSSAVIFILTGGALLGLVLMAPAEPKKESDGDDDEKQ